MSPGSPVISDSVRKAALDDVLLDVFRGAPLKKPTRRGTSETVRVAAISTLTNTYLGTEDIEPTEVQSSRLLSRYQLQEGDVLVAARGRSLEVCVVGEIDASMVASSNLAVLRPDPSRLFSLYLLFVNKHAGLSVMSTQIRMQRLESSGSSVKCLPWKLLNGKELYLEKISVSYQ